MRPLFVVLLVVSLASCTNNGKIPADVIPRRKMETVIWQLMQSDEYVNKRLIRDTLKRASVEKMSIYQQVFDLNGITMIEFRKSYQYYMSHPDITKVMFDSIAVRAGKQRADIYKPRPVVPVRPSQKP